MPSGKTLGVGVIGLGMGRVHLESYQKHPRARVSAICDADRARLEEIGALCGVPAERRFTDWRRMLRQARGLDLQAVSVALPNVLHAPVTVGAFRAGLHVLCEKPMAMNARQARAMLAAGRRARRKLMINFSFRFNEQSQALKRFADSGAIGNVYFARTCWHRRRGIPRLGGWFTQKRMSGGGPIIDLGVHRLDLAMWLMGNPRPVTVSGSTFDHLGSRLARWQRRKFDVEDLGCALVRFDNAATLMLEASWAGFSEKREDMVTQLLGTEGGIIQRNTEEGYAFEARVYTQGQGTLWEGRLQQALEPSPSAYHEFVDAVLDGHPVPAPGEHGLAVQLVLDAIYRSAATGREVRIAGD